MDKQIISELAKEKVASLEKELSKWKKFLSDIEISGFVVFDDSTDPALPTIPVSSLSNGAPSTKLIWADLIRDYFRAHDNKSQARIISKWIFDKADIPAGDHTASRSKIYAQLSTFEKQGKCKSGKVKKKVYYEWTAKEEL